MIQHATSLGAVESTIERRACISGQEHLPPTLLRLSVGIEAVEDIWADLDQALRATAQELGVKAGQMFQPIRVAVSGSAVSPPIFESLEFLGREKTLARIARCVTMTR